MIPITYVRGDATQPVGSGLKYLCHIVNGRGLWGKGFVVAVSRRWMQVRKAYKDWAKDKEEFYVGNIQLVPVRDDLVVVNMIAQLDIARSKDDRPLDYQALGDCLGMVAAVADGSGSVHMPRIGCGLAKGSWQMVEPLIVRHLCERDIPVTVYDWP